MRIAPPTTPPTTTRRLPEQMKQMKQKK